MSVILAIANLFVRFPISLLKTSLSLTLVISEVDKLLLIIEFPNYGLATKNVRRQINLLCVLSGHIKKNQAINVLLLATGFPQGVNAILLSSWANCGLENSPILEGFNILRQ